MVENRDLCEWVASGLRAMRTKNAASRGTDAPGIWNLAWVVTAVVATVAYVAGRWLVPEFHFGQPSGLTFLASVDPSQINPESLEQQRYVIAVAGAYAVAPLTALLWRHRTVRDAARGRCGQRSALSVQLLLLGLLVVGLVDDRGALGRWFPALRGVGWLVVLAVLAAGSLVMRGRRRPFAPGRTRQVELLDRAAPFLALSFAVAVGSVGFFTDDNAYGALPLTGVHLPYTFGDIYAVRLGRVPLGDYIPQYGALMSWVLAPILALRPPGIGMFTATMAALTAASLMCWFAALRLLTGTRRHALMLFVPLVAIAFVPVSQRGPQAHTIASYFAAMPIRYAGPLATSLALAWWGRGATPRRAAAVGAIASAAALSNFEFGLFSMFGALLAIAVVAGVRAVLPAAAAAAVVIALFSVGTSASAGRLVHLGDLVYFNRQFASAGYYMVPMPRLLGLHALLFVLFVATLVAGWLSARSDRQGVSAALMVWSGTFGFGAFAYYLGRSVDEVLVVVFLAAGIAASLLLWELLGAGGVSRHIRRSPGGVALAILAWLASTGGVMRSSYLLEQPTRWGYTGLPRVFEQRPTVAAIRACVPPGTVVLVMVPMGDRIADAAGVVNRFPYNSPGAIVTTQQVDRIVEAMRGARAVITTSSVAPEVTHAVASSGFRIVLERANAVTEEAPAFSLGGSRIAVWDRPGRRALTCRTR